MTEERNTSLLIKWYSMLGEFCCNKLSYLFECLDDRFVPVASIPNDSTEILLGKYIYIIFS